MKRPEAGEDCESNKHQRKGPLLETLGERKYRQFGQLKGMRARNDIRRDQADKNHRAANEGINRQLHRAVFLVGRAPDRDEKIFWDDRQFVEYEQQEQIEAEENSVDSADQREIKCEVFL